MRISDWSSDVCSSDLAGSIAEGIDLAGSLQPDVILTDRRLPDGDVDQHMNALVAASPGARVLLMTGWPPERASPMQSAERRVGKECVCNCSSRWRPDHKNKTS